MDLGAATSHIVYLCGVRGYPCTVSRPYSKYGSVTAFLCTAVAACTVSVLIGLEAWVV